MAISLMDRVSNVADWSYDAFCVSLGGGLIGPLFSIEPRDSMAVVATTIVALDAIQKVGLYVGLNPRHIAGLKGIVRVCIPAYFFPESSLFSHLMLGLTLVNFSMVAAAILRVVTSNLRPLAPNDFNH